MASMIGRTVARHHRGGLLRGLGWSKVSTFRSLPSSHDHDPHHHHRLRRWTQTQSGGSGNPYPSRNPNFKHQEIEGPTVERDSSAVAEETRRALEGAVRAVHGLSRAAAAVGLVHLGIGAWAWWARARAGVDPDPMWTALSAAGFAMPMSMALVMRRAAKPVLFFRKMEEQGRLQILTLALQSFKAFDQMFYRLGVVAYASALALSLALLYRIIAM